MHERRFKPGMILLTDDEQIQRILVAGGRRNTTEMLKIACTNTSDRGQCTLIAPLSKLFNETFLVCFNGRILAFGKCHLTDRMSFALFTEQSVNKINAPNMKYQRFIPHT